jgi:hypothetical protein
VSRCGVAIKIKLEDERIMVKVIEIALSFRGRMGKRRIWGTSGMGI